MELISFTDDKINCKVLYENKQMIIKGSLFNANNYKKKIIIAPNSPDNLTSYSGSFLPFPSEEIALEKTKNFYEIKNDGIIDIKFSFPNSYYNEEFKLKIKSPFILILDNSKFIYETVDINPLKTLRDRIRGDPNFYALKEVILPVADAQDNMINYSNAKLVNNIA
jgi:hypothetical protein